MSFIQIATLIVDIGLGALAYKVAREAKITITAVRAEVTELRETVGRLVKVVF